MTTKALADWLVTATETALTVTAYKGFPAWGLPTLTLPCAAVLFESHNPTLRTTTGRWAGAKSTTFVVIVYTKNEIQLWSYLDTLQAYWIASGTPSIGNERVILRQDAVDRLTGDNIPEQARYAFQQRVTFEHK